MFDKISSESQYKELLSEIEEILCRATAMGGFSSMSEIKVEELYKLTLLAEKYEEETLPMIIPPA